MPLLGRSQDCGDLPSGFRGLLSTIISQPAPPRPAAVRLMLERPGYLEEYVSFWNARPEVNRILGESVHSQIGEQSTRAMLTREHRKTIANKLPRLSKRFPKLFVNSGIAGAFVDPPSSPKDCLFSKMSVNYSADLETRVEPCVFGGAPDCSAMRVSGEQRAALDSHRKGRGSVEGRAFRSRLSRHRLFPQPPQTARRSSFAVASRRSDEVGEPKPNSFSRFLIASCVLASRSWRWNADFAEGMMKLGIVFVGRCCSLWRRSLVLERKPLPMERRSLRCGWSWRDLRTGTQMDFSITPKIVMTFK